MQRHCMQKINDGSLHPSSSSPAVVSWNLSRGLWQLMQANISYTLMHKCTMFEQRHKDWLNILSAVCYPDNVTCGQQNYTRVVSSAPPRSSQSKRAILKGTRGGGGGGYSNTIVLKDYLVSFQGRVQTSDDEYELYVGRNSVDRLWGLQRVLPHVRHMSV